jgi:hypothetical protein
MAVRHITIYSKGTAEKRRPLSEIVITSEVIVRSPWTLVHKIG